MVLVKTPAGQQAIKDRHGSLSSRQRSAFILFDGKRTTGEILAATAAMGITQEDIQEMISQGLLEPLPRSKPSSSPGVSAAEMAKSAPASAPLGAAATAPLNGSGRSPMQRYQAAYPIATELTASLGLRGFRLNLAVEGASGFEDLAALAPRIRDAVGDAKFERLEKALFG